MKMSVVGSMLYDEKLLDVDAPIADEQATERRTRPRSPPACMACGNIAAATQ